MCGEEGVVWVEEGGCGVRWEWCEVRREWCGLKSEWCGLRKSVGELTSIDHYITFRVTFRGCRQLLMFPCQRRGTIVVEWRIAILSCRTIIYSTTSTR